MQKFYWVLQLIILQMFTVQIVSADSIPRIYIIRHANVDLPKPGWGSAKKSKKYKNAYNTVGIETFNPEEALHKIENHASIDTVFCSPQLRAQETALLLFSEDVILETDSVLIEFDYPVIQIPVLQLPVKGWLAISRITWMTGINRGKKSNYKNRISSLNDFSDELSAFALNNELAVVVAHGFVNRKLIKLLKANGWKFCKKGRDGHKNLSVNCLEYDN